jgi:anti-sigma B factor antagonist
MEIARRRVGDIVEVELTGRLDSYWSDHLNAALTEVLRDGNHHIRIDCSQVSYLTSAGIGVLARFYKELGRINGTLQVVNPSPSVLAVLQISRLSKFLVATSDQVAPVAPRERAARRFDYQNVGFEVFDLDEYATLTCRTVGTARPLAGGTFEEEHCSSFERAMPTFALGVGAFGGSFADCRARFGELLSVVGATAYQPGDGTNVADYLVAADGLGADIRVLYCIACEGRFSHLVRFETLQPGGATGLSLLLAGCFEAVSCDALGVVIVAEAGGLVGAALRRAPTQRIDAGGFFTHPGLRTRLMFTTERAFPRSVVLAAGVVTRDGRGLAHAGEQLRPIGQDRAGHFHAVAFRFRPLQKGAIDLGKTVMGLFEPEQLLGVLHLLHDDRAIAGSGESEFVRGACWIGPIAGNGLAA